MWHSRWSFPVPLLLILLAGVLLFLTFNRHSKSGFFNYHSEIWGDKAGYYIYLPALFIYSFNADRFPESMDSLTGNGFSLDLEKNRVVTKYPAGVAMLMSPFFLTTHLLTEFLDAEPNGFSAPYHRMIDVAAVVYLIAGMVLLYRFLRKHFSCQITLLTLSILLLGTNIYYYAVDETGMSHVYSFFLFSLYLFLSQRLSSSPHPPAGIIIAIGATAALIIAVRPVNVIFLPLILFLDACSTKEVWYRFQHLFCWKHTLILITVGFIILLPQFLYWHSAFGKWIYYTYQGEGFTNLGRPQIIPYLFSTNNGLLLYNPVALFGFSGIVLMILNKDKNAWMVLTIIIATLYLFSSWWLWNFGCGYGNRSYVEYFTILGLPFGYQMKAILQHPRKIGRWIWGGIILLLVLVNLKMIYTWDGCWYGGTWDWKQFVELLTAPPK